MADVKISALPAATTPLAGTEVLPIVQSSTTKKVAISDVTAGRAISASSLTLTTPLSVSNGGTGFSSITSGYVPYATGTNTLGATSGLQFDGNNLGLGVTPSAWASVTAFQIADSGAIAGNNQYLEIETNTYYNAGHKYIGTGLAAKYGQEAGKHVWYNAPSGTAGNAISFTQAMTLDASGNLLVGTTTANGLLTVAGIARGGLANRAGTYTAGSTTPSVTGVSYMTITNSSATTITNFTGATDGQMLYLVFTDANTTINRANAYLAGGADFVSTAFDTLVLMFSNFYSGWVEVSRSANS